MAIGAIDGVESIYGNRCKTNYLRRVSSAEPIKTATFAAKISENNRPRNPLFSGNRRHGNRRHRLAIGAIDGVESICANRRKTNRLR